MSYAFIEQCTSSLLRSEIACASVLAVLAALYRTNYPVAPKRPAPNIPSKIPSWSEAALKWGSYGVALGIAVNTCMHGLPEMKALGTVAGGALLVAWVFDTRPIGIQLGAKKQLESVIIGAAIGAILATAVAECAFGGHSTH